ncbi:MAG: lamin tail domain-containing protein [Actinomycetota bacterium]
MDRRLTLLAAGAFLAGGCTLTIEGGGSADPSSPSGVGGATLADNGTATGAGPAADVVRLSDGDSGWFLIDGDEVEIRLLGYNAPERFEGDGGPLSCNGQAAELALADLLADAEAVEAVGDETDRFGRRLVDLAVDGRSVVDRLVADGRGLATGDDRDGRVAMWAAADAGRGLWGDECGVAAADGLVIERVEADPPGRDEENLNGEVVELVNTGPEAIDLTGWDIRDDSASHRFDLEGTMGPGERLVIRMGAGRSTPGELFLDSGTPVWSNRGDTVLVIDPGGVVAAWYFVGR